MENLQRSLFERCVIDSSVILSSLNPDDCFYEESCEFLMRVKQDSLPCFMSSLGLMECLQVYYRQMQDLDKLDAVFQSFIDWNLDRRLLRFIDLEASFLAYFVAHQHKLSTKTSDSIMALTAKRLNCPLVTWDKQLLAQSGEEFQVVKPNEFFV